LSTHGSRPLSGIGCVRHRWGNRMAFEEIKAQISLLLEEMVNQPEDEHEFLEQVREKLNEMRAMGMPLPDDLLELEKQLEERFPESKS